MAIIDTARYQGHTYHLLGTDGAVWWSAAEAEARRLGGHLVTVNDAAENRFLLERFGPVAESYAAAHGLPDQQEISLWLGLSDRAHEGRWAWASGETSSYTNWQPGEPASAYADEDFAGMFVNFGTPGRWHDIVADMRLADLPFGVVEVPGRTTIVGNRQGNLLNGTNQDDTIIGRGGDDRLYGWDGRDELIGDFPRLIGEAQGSDDRLFGGAGEDALFGDGSLSEEARGGNDLLDGGAGNDALYGDGDLADTTHGGNDRLYGGAGGDWLVGDGDLHWYGDGETDNASGGNDRLEGGTGNDKLIGDCPEMFDDATGGDDQLYGGLGNDWLYGDAQNVYRWDSSGPSGARCGADRLDGGAGDDRLYGDVRKGGDEEELARVTCGTDVLIGGAGNDQLWGDLAESFGGSFTAADRFVFARGSGRDTIGDFNAFPGNDRIDLTGYRGIDNFREIRAHTIQRGDDAAIDLGAAAGGPAGQDVVTLSGVDRASLGAWDFIFA
jgi:Ca2+-binding RTX toxin-like protein